MLKLYWFHCRYDFSQSCGYTPKSSSVLLQMIAKACVLDPRFKFNHLRGALGALVKDQLLTEMAALGTNRTNKDCPDSGK